MAKKSGDLLIDIVLDESGNVGEEVGQEGWEIKTKTQKRKFVRDIAGRMKKQSRKGFKLFVRRVLMKYAVQTGDNVQNVMAHSIVPSRLTIKRASKLLDALVDDILA